MRIKTGENGNVTLQHIQHKRDIVSHNKTEQSEGLPAEDTTNRSKSLNCNTLYNSRSAHVIENYSDDIGNVPENTLNLVAELICNRQYRINSRNVNTDSLTNFEPLKISVTDFTASDLIIGTTNVYEDSTPIDEEKIFEHSDTDEMSENGVQTVPRGIVNPNYPGFQHLAHTLQDYSSSIENFYHSENEMTDDDVDIEITDLAYEADPVKTRIYNDCEYHTSLNNNNNTQNYLTKHVVSSDNESHTQTYSLGSQLHTEIPDLLKTISKNNNNNNELFLTYYDADCTDTDIENNFHTKDIIGDFNKEIEDEIKQLLNYNINIQDDLEELRKDIKDTFSKPIENTINNISDVVNHVIKKLVETKSEGYDDELIENNINQKKSEEKEINEINNQNERNTQTEMNLSRPTFLLFDHDRNGKIADAFLSDGKDEINIEEYDAEKLSLSVENTIKQLSTELRKIIPKLDEMRQRDKLWAECRNDTFFKDGNSNEVSNPPITSPNRCFDAQVQSKTVSQSLRHSGSDSGSQDTRNIQNDHKVLKEKKSDTTSNTSRRTTQGQHKISVHKSDSELESFDVYNIETALPKLDIDAIENHLKAAKEAERRKRNDREEIRRRLAMGGETEEYYSMGYNDRPGKKPSLHSRLQNGMNLQICFMNETASDNESQASDLDKSFSSTKSLSRSSLLSKSSYNHPYQTRPLSVSVAKHDKISTVQSGAKLRPSSLTLKSTKSRSTHSLGHIEIKESDFYVLQATLQTEARMALAQAKEMARIQMERERRARPASPVTEMLRRSMLKANTPLAPDRRRVSRQILTDMNIAQLQVIVNELHSQIEGLNDSLVKLLMARDELHMGQDSMLVDIEDLTRYLGVKEQTKKTKGATNKSSMKRLSSLVHK